MPADVKELDFQPMHLGITYLHVCIQRACTYMYVGMYVCVFVGSYL